MERLSGGCERVGTDDRARLDASIRSSRGAGAGLGTSEPAVKGVNLDHLCRADSEAGDVSSFGRPLLRGAVLHPCHRRDLLVVGSAKPAIWRRIILPFLTNATYCGKALKPSQKERK